MLFFPGLKWSLKIPTDSLLLWQQIADSTSYIKWHVTYDTWHVTIHMTPTNLVLRLELQRNSSLCRAERDRNNGILTIHLGCRLLHPDRDWCQHRDIPRHNQAGCRMSREHQEDRWSDHQAQYLSGSLETRNWQTWLLVWGNFQTILSPDFDASLIF